MSPHIEVSIDPVEPARLHAGQHQLVRVTGRAFNLRSRVRAVTAVIDGRRYPAAQLGGPTPELAAEVDGTPRMTPQAGRAGFIVLGVVAPLTVGRHDIRVEIELDDGRRTEVDAGSLEAVARPSRPTVERPARVTVCMATHEPDIELFMRQVDSIRDQRFTDWACVISDDGSSTGALAAMRAVLAGDPRFTLHTHGERAGFYRNFERALQLVPAGSELVALADQDDAWYPHKLERLLAELDDPAVALACSDTRIVDRDGRELAPSFYTHRGNSAHDPLSLFMVNSIIGASMLFRASLLPAVVELPTRRIQPYHDHWIARVALTAGRISFVAEPLYDYVQHGGNVLGFERARPRWRGELAHPWGRLATGEIPAWDQRDWATYDEALELDAAEAELALRRAEWNGFAVPAATRRAVARLRSFTRASLPALGRVSAMWLYDQFGRKAPMHESIEMLHLRGMVWKRLQTS